MEHSQVIQARIEGVQVQQIPVVNRLRALGVPDELINAAASGDVHQEQVIITWFMEKHGLPEDAAVRVLNGETSLEHERSGS